MCVRVIVHIFHTQHSTEQLRFIIFPPNFQTIIRARALSVGWEGVCTSSKTTGKEARGRCPRCSAAFPFLTDRVPLVILVTIGQFHLRVFLAKFSSEYLHKIFTPICLLTTYYIPVSMGSVNAVLLLQISWSVLTTGL